MMEGRRPVKSTNWSKLESKSVNLITRPKYADDEYASCGTSAISIITGIDVYQLDKFNKSSMYWECTKMKRYLESKGFIVTEVTKRNICNTYWNNHQITKNHIILAVCRMGRTGKDEEYSAVVMHKGKIWHNFRLENDPLYFFNKPTEWVIVVSHPDWNQVENNIVRTPRINNQYLWKFAYANA